jgi:hypothetical protein
MSLRTSRDFYFCTTDEHFRLLNIKTGKRMVSLTD